MDKIMEGLVKKYCNPIKRNMKTRYVAVRFLQDRWGFSVF